MPQTATSIFVGLQAALFDLDNTLIETHIDFPLMKRTVLDLAAGYGLDAERLSTLDILGIVAAARDMLVASGDAERADDFRRAAFAALEEIEVSHCAAPVELPGAAELLQELRRAAIAVGIVTRNCRTVSERLISTGRLECDVLVTRDDVEQTKPHPGHLREALRIAAERRSAAPYTPGSCLMVGDHWMDVAAGRAAGMRTIGLRRNREPAFFAPAPPDLELEDIAELRNLFHAAERMKTG